MMLAGFTFVECSAMQHAFKLYRRDVPACESWNYAIKWHGHCQRAVLSMEFDEASMRIMLSKQCATKAFLRFLVVQV